MLHYRAEASNGLGAEGKFPLGTEEDEMKRTLTRIFRTVHPKNTEDLILRNLDKVEAVIPKRK